MPRFQTHSVLAGRYIRGRVDSARTHTLDNEKGVVLCRRVKAEGLADEYATDADAKPSCAVCALRDPRFNPESKYGGSSAKKHRIRRAVFYAIRKRDGKYVCDASSPIQWSDKPLVFKSKSVALAFVKARLDAAVATLGIKVVKL